MRLGEGIRRNIVSAEPVGRALLRTALILRNQRFFAGTRTGPRSGGVLFERDEGEQGAHSGDRDAEESDPACFWRSLLPW